MKKIMMLFVLAAASVAMGQDYCGSLPQVVRTALVQMEHPVPCDIRHIVVIPNLHNWVVRSARGEYDRDPIWKQAENRISHSLAFAVGTQYPIYVNAELLPLEVIESGRDRVALARLTCILTHEQTHANGEARETVAYQSELGCIERMIHSGVIAPHNAWDIEQEIHQQITNYAKKEKKA